MVRLCLMLLARRRPFPQHISEYAIPESYKHIKHGQVKWRDYKSTYVEPPYYYKWTMDSPYSPMEQRKIRAKEHINWYRHNYDKIKYTPPDKWLFHVGDKVEILAGKDKGKKGEVVMIVPQRNWVVVGGRNFKYRQTESNEVHAEEQPLEHDEVALLDPVDNEKTDIEFKANEKGDLVRVSVRSGHVITIPLEMLADRTLKCEYLEQSKDTNVDDALKRTFTPSISTVEQELVKQFNVETMEKEFYWY
ncbi:large ribosomal subunit protein uL24m-like [Styela clava]